LTLLRPPFYAAEEATLARAAASVNEGYWVVQVKGDANPEYVVTSKADTAVKTPVVRRAGVRVE
jgi:hypothetical protein